MPLEFQLRLIHLPVYPEWFLSIIVRDPWKYRLSLFLLIIYVHIYSFTKISREWTFSSIIRMEHFLIQCAPVVDLWYLQNNAETKCILYSGFSYCLCSYVALYIAPHKPGVYTVTVCTLFISEIICNRVSGVNYVNWNAFDWPTSLYTYYPTINVWTYEPRYYVDTSYSCILVCASLRPPGYITIDQIRSDYSWRWSERGLCQIEMMISESDCRIESVYNVVVIYSDGKNNSKYNKS